MITLYCEDCGTRYPARGDHTCPPRRSVVANKPVASATMANDVANAPVVANLDMANAPSMANDVANAGSTYRYRDPDQRRGYMADYMRRKRASGRGA